ncbi:porphobilinogen deaminase [Fimbriimonas ginsengisoli Gsoil 348]|uniref:Hydroxymethylbilane synthase n=2 Tax=Fimbriimonas ginsengisoli TaxID=1005039 RepID=A0A068NRQ9_FIMGI|nr:porphobilinogen deaminase [Fimbriimonas ginsengisoli Gsoil 348]
MVQESLQRLHPGLDVEIVTIRTSGDRGERERLGAFVREIQEALLANQVDVALHCLKDLPTEPVPGLSLSAYLEREDARDTLISRGPGLESLPEGSVIGTGSLRRTSQIANVRNDVVFKPLVGNVDTRMRKLIEGEYDAIVLALAGLKRLGLMEDWGRSEYKELVVWPKSVETIVPAPGQAVLVLETREADAAAIELISPLHHSLTSACSRAERSFLQAFGGGCSVPIGAYAQVNEHGFGMIGCVASPDGKQYLKGNRNGSLDAPEEMGAEFARELGGHGAFEIVQAVLATRDGGIA